MEKKDATYVVSVQASVRDIVRLGLYFDQLDVYREAKPAGMLAVAIKWLVNILEGSQDLVPIDSLEEALIAWGRLRYPRAQLDTQLRQHERTAERAAMMMEAQEMYGPSAGALTKLRSDMSRLNDEQLGRLRQQGVTVQQEGEGFNLEEFKRKEAEKLAAIKQANLEMMKQAGALAEEE